jgi:hypothetical protein
MINEILLSHSMNINNRLIILTVEDCYEKLKNLRSKFVLLS